MSVLDKVRRWIDGDSAEMVLEEAARDAQIKPRSLSEEFIVKIARGVEEVMQREMVPLPQGTTLIPTEYIIFLSEADDKEWQGVKRRGLEQGLYHILAERAKEISGKKKLETNSFAVELRVDGTLEKGDIRVQHSWAEHESDAPKTGIIPNLKPAPQPVQKQNPPPVYQSQTPTAALQTPNYNPIPTPATNPNINPTAMPTVLPSDFSFANSQQSENDAEEMTQVKSRQASELYRLEIWHNGVRQSVMPIFENQIGIGRGSKSKPVDVVLSGDPEISRRHLSLAFHPTNGFVLLSEGKNGVLVAGSEIPTGERIQIAPGQPIAVCSYLLRIQPK